MSKPERMHDHKLRVAVAAATLGMSMGIQPSQTLARPSQPGPSPNESAAATPEPMRLAAAFAKYDGVDGESDKAAQEVRGADQLKHEAVDRGSIPMQKPGAEFHKVEPAAVQRPGTAYPKVETPAAQRPSAAYPKVEAPGAPAIPGR